MLQLSMKPTGWFHIGWSAEIPAGGVKAMKYFGQELVAFRTEAGELRVLDAHCRHLGAHLGHGGHVERDCVVCPYHGWHWDGEGTNVLVPYQDLPTRATMRAWPVAERDGLMYLWHDPAGGGPRAGWTYPDVFNDFEELPADAADYFGCYPHAIVDKPHERIHPQLVLENSADCTHFKFTHSAPEYPRMEWFETSGTRWRAQIGFVSPRTKEVALHLHNSNNAIGVTAAVFNSPKQHYRLILTATPVDDEHSDLRASYFLPRGGVTGDELPADLAAFAGTVEGLFEEDARIWRHQAFVQKPVYALDDRAGYSALRKWCEQFYEAPEGQSVMTVVND
ncbi:MAG: aromatic ring-hydroxylating dioxygenase subunit alpha [Acidimicrobiia bacterium]